MANIERWTKKELIAECQRQAQIANGAMIQADESAKIQARLRMEVVQAESKLRGAVDRIAELERALKLARYWIDPDNERGPHDLSIVDAALGGQ